MKRRWSIAAALFFALVWASAALQASASPTSAFPCRLAKSHFRSKQAGARTGRSPILLLASVPGHHTPAPRLHRIRGKKINIDGSAIPALKSIGATHYLVADSWLPQQDPDGPNPSRGPPSHISL